MRVQQRGIEASQAEGILVQKHWKELTPITTGQEWCYKREDLFRPFSDRSINGSKLRQVYHLCEYARTLGYSGIVSGAVSASPQHPMVTRVAREYGLSSTICTGVSKLDNYPMLRMAKDDGAEFELCPVGYAAALNGVARSMAQRRNLFHLETNITVTGSSWRIYRFHQIGAGQVANIPDRVRTMFIPAGSCNSAVSVMVGLAENPVRDLRRIVLFGIGAQGSNDTDYIPDRLRRIGRAAGIDYTDVYDFDLERDAEVARRCGGRRIKVVRYDLNGSGFCRYGDVMPETLDGITFHPRYEGKIIRYIKGRAEDFARYKDVCFWNVGTDPA